MSKLSSAPFFSIIVPTYNRASFLPTLINSLIGQTYCGFEVIIVDDGSTDETREVVSRFTDKRIKYHYKNNGERGAARNYGAQVSIGDYVNFFDSDDYALPNHLEAARRFIMGDALPAFHTSYIIKGNRRSHLRVALQGNLNSLILRRNVLSCNGVFLRRDIAIAHPFSEDRALSGSEDWLLWLKLAARVEIHGCKEITHCVVQHCGRSMQLSDGGNTIARGERLLQHLREDSVFITQCKRHLAHIEGSIYILAALDYAIARQRLASVRSMLRAISRDVSLIFTRRFLGVVKQLLISGPRDGAREKFDNKNRL